MESIIRRKEKNSRETRNIIRKMDFQFLVFHYFHFGSFLIELSRIDKYLGGKIRGKRNWKEVGPKGGDEGKGNHSIFITFCYIT